MYYIPGIACAKLQIIDFNECIGLCPVLSWPLGVRHETYDRFPDTVNAWANENWYVLGHCFPGETRATHISCYISASESRRTSVRDYAQAQL